MYPQQYTTRKPSIAHWQPKALLALIPVLAIIGWVAYQTTTFHIVRSDPSFKHFPAISPMISIYFNKELSTDGLSLKANGFTMSGYDVNDKVLEIKMPVGGLQVGKTYSLSLVHVASTDHKLIANKTITFTTKDISSTKLSTAQQKALVEQQDQYRYSVTAIQFQNFDLLLNHGLTADQLQSVKDSLYGYSNQIQQQFRVITLQPDSLQSKIHDVSTGNFDDITSFNVETNHSTYRVELVSNVVSGNVHVVILDASGTQVYDSTQAHD